MTKKVATNKENIDIPSHIDSLAKKGLEALEEFSSFSQEQIDSIVKAMALAGHSAQLSLAKFAVEETGRGIVEDKVIKNIFATEYIHNSIKYNKTVGIIDDNELEGYIDIAEPVGVIAGVTPVTNPTSTTMFKALISVKTRNPIIFAFHPSAQNCSAESARILRDAAIKAGAPKNCIQWIEYPSIEGTGLLMNHPSIALVLATGGSAMVKSAYSTGKPALGVGPGNVPCFIEKSANIKQAVTDLIMSKSFDNGMICASEQAAIIEASIYKETTDYMKKNGCYFCTPAEVEKITPIIINLEYGSVNANIVGMSPFKIAKLAGIDVDPKTKVICCEIDGVGPDHPLSREKLSPVLAVIKAKDVDHGLSLCEAMLNLGGLGHTSVIHSYDDEVIMRFSSKMKTGRIILNSPSSQGAIGDIYNVNIPSLTLGCGSYGKNSVSTNVSSVNLINTKRVAKRMTNMQWFKIPEKIFFEFNSIQYLEKMENVNRVVIVTDEGMVKLGYVDKIMHYLKKRRNNVQYKIFSDVETDPSFDTVKKGAAVLTEFEPDVIIALGGGSPMDAAKGMWLLYEQPDVDLAALSQKFLDVRKRINKIPNLGVKAKLVAIPTTSGTGSEVTSFAVISDKENNIKYPLADYALTPSVAIIDPSFVMTVPKSITADTGIDVLTHAIETYVSIVSSDYSDALAARAVQMVFEYLPLAYEDGSNKLAREKMHNASCMAGMAFTNAFLGVNHSLAHKIGGEFHISHGKANAILLPLVIEYNGDLNPTKFVPFPKYNYYIAPEKYQELAKMLGLKADTPEQGVKSLANAVRDLCKKVGIAPTIKECGIKESDFLAQIDKLSERAFDDQCTTANPRLPLISELKEILNTAYYGK
jgi:acetaldehyde dehydrogenase / alcohol dehydrogenase